METTSDRKSTEWNSLVAKADVAQRERKYEFAEATWMFALEEAESFGEEDRRLPYTLEKLSENLWIQNRFDEALFFGIRAMKIYEKVLGDQHYDVGAIAGNMARILHQQRKYAEAEGLYKRSLAIKTASLGPKHPEVQQLLTNFADLLTTLGRGEEASQLRTSASMPTKRQWTKTGSFKAVQKDIAKNELARPSTPLPPISDEFSGKNMSWQDFKAEAERCMQRGDNLEAERVWIMSLPTARGQDENNPNHCYALEAIGELSMRLEKFKDAERCYQKSYDIKVRVLGNQHIAIAHGASNLAKLYYSMCDYSKAEKMARQAVDVFERVNGSDNNTDLACALHNLATLYHVQRIYDRAEAFYQRAMTMKQKIFGPDHPETLRLLKSYANLLKSTHREEQARHLDDCADGMITGSWKTIQLPEGESLSGGWAQVNLRDE